MALTPRYLIDSSVTARLAKGPVAERVSPLIQRGLAATCEVLDIEAGHAAQSSADYQQIMDDRSLLYAWAAVPDRVFETVLAMQRRLVKVGTHRGVGIADLLIAATALFHDLTVLHYDHDFDLITDVTDSLRTEWVAPAGTVD